MKTVICMMYDGNARYGVLTEEINREYAKARGYDFIVYRHLPDPNLDPYWNRFRILQHELERCDLFWWIDADAFFLRHDQNLPPATHDLTISTDWNGICCGVMAVKNVPWVHRLINAWMLLGNVRGDRINGFDNGQFREQTTLKAMCYYWPMVECHIGKISEEIVQCPSSKFNANALVLHCWNAWIGSKRIIQTVERFKADGHYRPETLERPN